MGLTRTFSPVLHFDDENGHPLVGGKLYTYVAGTSTPVVTFADDSGSMNTNPVILNERGECRLFLEEGKGYKFVLKDCNDVTIWSADRIYPQIRFVAEGEGAIGTEETTEGGVTTLRVYIKPNSICRDLLYNHHNLIPDSRYLQFKDFGGKVVVSLCDALQAWLRTEGYPNA